MKKVLNMPSVTFFVSVTVDCHSFQFNSTGLARVMWTRKFVHVCLVPSYFSFRLLVCPSTLLFQLALVLLCLVRSSYFFSLPRATREMAICVHSDNCVALWSYENVSVSQIHTQIDESTHYCIHRVNRQQLLERWNFPTASLNTFTSIADFMWCFRTLATFRMIKKICDMSHASVQRICIEM